MQVLDTQSGSLKTLTDKSIKWYTCGPTVYDSAHLGHARTYVMIDTMRRILEFYGYDVNFIMNITDIDDKIINNKSDAKFFEREFFEDMKQLNVKYPTSVLHVTDYVPKIITFIERIIQNGYAYVSNGSVYFDINAYINQGFKYDIFVKSHVYDQEEQPSSEKRSPSDFALWKRAKSGPSWESPWGNGRPGWHIECSVMASDLVDHLDIHSGGIDLRFPHHQNEIAQINAYHNKDISFVGTFVHTGHLHIDGLKMSKSLKNFVTIRDALKQITPRQLRIMFAMTHYSKTFNFTTKAFEEFRKIDIRLASYLNTNFSKDDSMDISKIKESLDSFLHTNFDVEGIMNYILHNLSTWSNSSVQDLVRSYLTVLGLDYNIVPNPLVDSLIKVRLNIRKMAKTSSDKKELYKVSDELRDIIQKQLNSLIADVDDDTIRLS